MKILKIVALDPGKTTGWVYGRCIDGRFELSNGEALFRIGHGQIGQKEEELGTLCRSVMESGVRVIVYEDFVLYAGRSHTGGTARSGVSPVDVMAFIRGWLFAEGWEGRFVGQMAAQAKSMCTNDRLKKAGLWFPGEPHARDAARHAWLHARVRYQAWFRAVNSSKKSGQNAT